MVLPMGRGIRNRLTYANVLATLALFLALGGGAYALTLPRNSVGSAQLRSDSVGRAEIRTGAVTSSAVRNRSVRLRDLAESTRNSLRGQVGPPGAQGPAGPSYFAAVDALGRVARGNARSSLPFGANGRLIGFSRPMHSCVATVSLATVPGAQPTTPPPTGHATVDHTPDGAVLVRTWSAAGVEMRLPFNLIVAC
jgi:hypothetical protein